ncbi:HAMP domain-containing protein [Streptomyces sirii]|uniref:HAMP domain-containing protein n=1 Tax=Streptomyces sirii TaxID=3127701 RepID=UPI003D361AC0
MPLLGGVRPPIAALLCVLLVVAAFTALALGTVHEQDVPQAVRDAERQIAEDAADSVGTSVNARAAAVRRAVASATPAGSGAPAAILRSFVPTEHPGQGAALLDPRTGRSLAASGETVPLTGVDVTSLARPGTANIAPRLASSGSAEPRLLLFARVTVPAPSGKKDENHDQAGDLADDQDPDERELLLVVSEKVAAPAVFGGGRTGQLVDRNGRVVAAANAAAALTPKAEHQAVPADAATAANAAKAALTTGDAAGSMLGDGPGGLRRVTGWASLAAMDGTDDTSDLGLTILTGRDVAPAREGADHTWFAVMAAGALVLIAVLVTAVLWGTMQRPLLRLHLSAARLARSASGTATAREQLARPVPVVAFGEIGRVGRALESIRRQLSGETGPEPARPVRRRPGVRALVLVCVLVIAAWGCPCCSCSTVPPPRRPYRPWPSPTRRRAPRPPPNGCGGPSTGATPTSRRWRRPSPARHGSGRRRSCGVTAPTIPPTGPCTCWTAPVPSRFRWARSRCAPSTPRRPAVESARSTRRARSPRSPPTRRSRRPRRTRRPRTRRTPHRPWSSPRSAWTRWTSWSPGRGSAACG